MARDLAHEESWLLLPWLANGRLSHAERTSLEEHLRGCALCERELAQQRLMREALAEPDRVTYAPGPSFRKLLERIDGAQGAAVSHAPERRPRAGRAPAALAALAARSAWHPPGLAWAATFLMAIGIASLALTSYRWSEPLYQTHTNVAPHDPTVLHIAFVPSLSVGEAGEALRAAGARLVEGPDAMGIFAVTSVSTVPPATAAGDREAALRALAARLRVDARVRWVEPLAAVTAGDRDRPPAAR
jgi:hypothetical protein